jgi:hypothetical protein
MTRLGAGAQRHGVVAADELGIDSHIVVGRAADGGALAQQMQDAGLAVGAHQQMGMLLGPPYARGCAECCRA